MDWINIQLLLRSIPCHIKSIIQKILCYNIGIPIDIVGLDRVAVNIGNNICV